METKQLRMVPFEARHASQVYLWAHDKDYATYFDMIGKLWTEQECLNFPNTLGATVLVFEDKETGQVAGMGTISWKNTFGRVVVTGHIIDKAFRGRGITKDIYHCLMQMAFQRFGARKLVIEVLATNEMVHHVARKWGLTLDATFKGEGYTNGEFVDILRYSLDEELYYDIQSELKTLV